VSVIDEEDTVDAEAESAEAKLEPASPNEKEGAEVLSPNEKAGAESNEKLEAEADESHEKPLEEEVLFSSLDILNREAVASN